MSYRLLPVPSSAIIFFDVDGDIIVLNQPAGGGIVVQGTATTVNTADPVSVSLTCAGADRYALGFIAWKEAGGTHTVSGVTYNGVSMGAVASSILEGDATVRIYGLVAPATGSNTLSFDLSSSRDTHIGGICFSGVDQTTPVGTPVTDTDSSNPITVTVSSAIGEIVVDLAISQGSAASTPGGSQTIIMGDGNYGGFKGLSSYQDGDTSVTSTWTNTDVGGWAVIGIAVKPAS